MNSSSHHSFWKLQLFLDSFCLLCYCHEWVILRLERGSPAVALLFPGVFPSAAINRKCAFKNQSLTKCKFCKSLVLTFIQNGGGVGRTDSFASSKPRETRKCEMCASDGGIVRGGGGKGGGCCGGGRRVPREDCQG